MNIFVRIIWLQSGLQPWPGSWGLGEVGSGREKKGAESGGVRERGKGHGLKGGGRGKGEGEGREGGERG